jgi:hypothetical protein
MDRLDPETSNTANVIAVSQTTRPILSKRPSRVSAAPPESAAQWPVFDTPLPRRLSNRRWGTHNAKYVGHCFSCRRACSRGRSRLWSGTAGLRVEKLQPFRRYAGLFHKRSRSCCCSDSGHDRKRLVRRRRRGSGTVAGGLDAVARPSGATRAAGLKPKIREARRRQASQRLSFCTFGKVWGRPDGGDLSVEKGEQRADSGGERQRLGQDRLGQRRQDDNRETRQICRAARQGRGRQPDRWPRCPAPVGSPVPRRPRASGVGAYALDRAHRAAI